MGNYTNCFREDIEISEFKKNLSPDYRPDNFHYKNYEEDDNPLGF